MKTYLNKIPIKNWADADRPREKFILNGQQTLSDAELMAILLRSGSRDESALALSKRILISVNNNLDNLGRISLKDFQKFKGVGEVKAISVLAALELGRRRQSSRMETKPKIVSSMDAFNIISQTLSDIPHEEFWILLLNRANLVLRKLLISQGGVAGTVVDSKIIFKHALENLACSIILCHNHPSSNLNPSHADVEITKKIKKAGQVLDIAVLDHLIIAGKKYYSFADEGMM